MNCGPMTDPATEPALDVSEDAFLGGQLRLRQLKSGHRAGHDAVLLAAATPARPGDRVADFGAGIGVAGLAVARRVGGIDLVLVEIDPTLADLARGNAVANEIAAEVIVLDVEANAAAFAACGLAPDSIDAVLMNPPFNDPARHRAFAGRRARAGARGDRNHAGELDSRRPAHPEIQGGADIDLASGRIGRGVVGARSRFWQPGNPAGSR